MLSHRTGFFIWEVIIFVILLIILKRVAWIPLCDYLRDKRKLILDSLDSVERIRVEVFQLNNENEKARVKVHEEILAIRNYTREVIENMLLEAEMKSKAEYEFIINDARYYIQKLKYDAINDIKNKTGKVVIEIVEEVLRRELLERGDQEAYILRLIQNLNLNK